MEQSRGAKEWKNLQHEPSARSDINNLIRHLIENDLKMPENPCKPIVNLGLGKQSPFSNL